MPSRDARADLSGALIDWEEGSLNEDEEVALFQTLVTSGMAWTLQGMYGRRAQALINAGLVTVPAHVGDDEIHRKSGGRHA